MNSKHRQDETLREYLLRTLPDEKADAIEERYLTDPLFFNRLRTVEVQLICDYLDGSLNNDELERFEERYLHVDALRELVEQVERRRHAFERASRRRLVAALAGALALCAIVSVAILQQRRTNTASTPAENASVSTSAASLGVVLTQRPTKGTGQSTPTLTLPNKPELVFLAAQLSGQ